MRLIQGNKVFSEWWNAWMSRLHSVPITTVADRKAATDKEHWQEKEESSDPRKSCFLR
jgi:hypothetical protein